MNEHLVTSIHQPGAGTTVGALPPWLAASAVGVVAGVLLVALGASSVLALGLAAILAVVIWLVAAARRVAEEWIRSGDASDGSAQR